MERLPPNMAPGGLVFRLTAAGRLHAEHFVDLAAGLDTAALDAMAAADGELALDLADRYGESLLHVYDGDTGECVQTVVTQAGAMSCPATGDGRHRWQAIEPPDWMVDEIRDWPADRWAAWYDETGRRCYACGLEDD